MLNKIYDTIITKFLKFGVIGIGITIFGIVSNFTLVRYFKTDVIYTYVVIYCIGICMSFYLNTVITYKTKIVFKKLIPYSGVYFITMGVGVLLLNFYKSLAFCADEYLSIFVVPFTMTLNFIGINYILKPKKEK